MKEYIRSVTVRNWNERDKHFINRLTIIVKTMDGKKVTVKTDGNMTVGQIVAAIVEELK